MTGFERESRPPDRRRQVDWVVKTAATLSVIAWLVAFTVLILLDFASPDRVDFFSNVWGGDLRAYWDGRLLIISFVMLLVSFICCVIAFLFNMMRMRRKTDKYRKSVFIMGSVSLVAIIVFIIRFGGTMFG